jgi:hypothetical protein
LDRGAIVKWTTAIASSFFLLVPALPARASDERGVFGFEWAVSGSSTSPWEQAAPPQVEDREVYLWMTNCAANCVRRVEFSFIGSIEVVSLTPVSGFTNLGTAVSPILEHDTCFPWQAAPVASLVIRDPDAGGGGLCFTEAVQTNRNCTATCDEQETLYRNWYMGFATDGISSCFGESTTPSCERIVSIDAVRWGRIKAQYRR